jgi:hypothetical protein
MQLRGGTLNRYGIALLGGYVAFFLLRHQPIPKDVPGLLAIWPSDYLRMARQWSPIEQLNTRLGMPLAAIYSLELVIVLAFLALVYFLAVRTVRSEQHISYSIRGILAWVALFSLPLLLLPFMLSRDIYSYVIYGRIAAIYGDNPAITPPISYAHDSFFQYLISWKDMPSVYGPVWTLVSTGITQAAEWAGGGLWVYMLAYKLAMIGAHLVSVVLIWHILAAWRPAQQGWGTLLYAWNPVVLIEFAGGAHNDVLMICLILAGVYCAQRGFWRRALVALIGAALVKWIAIILLPLYILTLIAQPQPWGARIRLGSQIAAIVIGVVLLLYLPYGQVARSISAPVTNQAAMKADNSLGLLAIKGVGIILSKLGSATAIKQEWRAAAMPVFPLVSKLLFLLAWLAGLYAIWRKPSFERFLQSGCWVFLVILLISPVLRVWYVTWPLALAALLDWRPLGRITWSFTVTAPLIYLDWGSNNLFGVLAFVPVIAALIYEIWHARAYHSRSLVKVYVRYFSSKEAPTLPEG